MSEKTKEEMEKEEKERSDGARADGDERMNEKLDAMLKGIDALRSDMASCNSRMDAFEKDDKERADKARKDAEDKEGKEGAEPTEEDKAKPLAADRARKDAEEKEAKEKEEKAKADAAEKERMDAVRADSVTIANLQKQIDALTKHANPSDAEYGNMIRYQARADEVYTQHGLRAPAPLIGETPISFRRRIADDLKKFSGRWKDKNLTLVAADEGVFSEVEGMIYADAIEEARRPTNIASDQLIVREERVGAHVHNKFFGHPSAWMNEIAGPVRQYVTKFHDDTRGGR